MTGYRPCVRCHNVLIDIGEVYCTTCKESLGLTEAERGQIDCEVSVPANIKLNPSGQRKLLEWIKFCFEIGWEKEQVNKLNEFWLEHHDEYGNLIKAH